MKKKGLIVIHDPHCLHQFMWFYFTYGKDIEWDALCLPNENGKNIMLDACDRASIFSKIYAGNVSYMKMALGKKILLFVQMAAYSVAGQRKRMCKKILNEYVDEIDEYDVLMANVDTGLISGMIASFGKEKDVIYLDDGMGDFKERSRFKSSFKMTTTLFWEGFLLSILGYCSKGRFFFKPTKNCYKFTQNKDEMKYRNYKRIIEYNYEKTDVELYNEHIMKVFPQLREYDFEKYDVILFTDSMKEFSEQYEVLNDLCVKYVENLSNTILVKRHPRDVGKYDFDPKTNVLEIDKELPAEIILPFISGKKAYFMYVSSVLLYLDNYGIEGKVLYSTDFYELSKTDVNASSKYMDISQCVQICERLIKGTYEIIRI